MEQDQTEQHAFVVEALPESLRGLSRELLAQTEKLEVLDDKLLEELLRGDPQDARGGRQREALTQYRFLQEEAQEEGDCESATLYQAEVLKLTQLEARPGSNSSARCRLKRME